MTLNVLGLDALRVAVILAVSLVVGRLLPPRAASLRRLARVTALGCALLLPLAARIAPRVALPASPLPAVIAHPFAEPASDATGAAAAPAAKLEPGVAPQRAPAPIDPATVAFAIWALVAAALLARVARTYAKASAIVNRADFAPDPRWRALVDQLDPDLGPRLVIGISDEIDTPATFGVLSSVLLLPRGCGSWSEARRRAVLAHELAHAGARDGLGRLVAHVVCALHWFDPFAWLSARALRVDQEIAADQAALAGGIAPSSYAATLVDVARAARTSSAATVAMATRSELERRVRAVLSTRPALRVSRPLSIAAAGTLAASALGLACAQPSPNETVAAGSPASTSAAAPPSQGGADAELQAIAEQEIQRLVSDTSASTAVVIALDPATGRVLAEAGRDHGASADVAFARTFVPGSTFKVVAVAAALDAGLVAKDSRFDCAPRAYGDRVLHDASSHASLSLAEVVALSSNVGVSRIFDALGEARFLASARRFHVGEAPPAIAGAAAGALPASLPTNSFEGGAVAAGEGALLASPAQIAAAYATIAAGGVYHAPNRTGASPGERVVSPEAAEATLALLDGAVNDAHATGSAARVDGVRVAGKTGTSDLSRDGVPHVYASFVGIAPREAPRLVVLVGADLTGARAEDAYGGKIAAPVFSRIIRRALAK